MKRILFTIIILILFSGIALGYELGAGDGTSYPATIDTDTNVEVDYPSPNATTARSAVPNDTNAAVIAIETELGINPSGEYDTLKARLDAGDWLYYLKTEIDTKFAELKFIDLVDTPAAYDNGKYAKSTADGIVWDDPAGVSTFIGLTDTPVNYTGGSLKFVRVNEGETALEFAAEADPTVDTDAEIKAILVDEVIKIGAFTAGRIAKINNATGIIEQGTNTDTDVSDAVTKKHSKNNDTALGIQTQDLNMGTHKIIGVVDPVNPQEAATKAYADTKVATEVDPTVDSDAEIKAILVDEVTKTGDFTANRLPEINNSSGIIEQSDIEHKANGGYDFNINSAGFTTQIVNGDGTTTCDWRIGPKLKFRFGALNETFSFTNPEFSCHLQIILVQDATGSRIATWPAGIFWAGGTIPTLSTAANARDIVNLFFDDDDDVYYGMGAGFAVP